MDWQMLEAKVHTSQCWLSNLIEAAGQVCAAAASHHAVAWLDQRLDLVAGRKIKGL